MGKGKRNRKHRKATAGSLPPRCPRCGTALNLGGILGLVLPEGATAGPLEVGCPNCGWILKNPIAGVHHDAAGRHIVALNRRALVKILSDLLSEMEAGIATVEDAVVLTSTEPTLHPLAEFLTKHNVTISVAIGVIGLIIAALSLAQADSGPSDEDVQRIITEVIQEVEGTHPAE